MVVIDGTVGIVELMELLFAVFGLSFVQDNETSWAAESYGGTRFVLTHEASSFRLEWTTDETHRLHRNERETFGDLENICKLLVGELQKRGYSATMA